MEIILINPPVGNPMQSSTGLAAIKGMLHYNGFKNVKIIDLNIIGWNYIFKNTDNNLTNLLKKRDHLYKSILLNENIYSDEHKRLLLLLGTKSLSESDIILGTSLMRCKKAFNDRSKYHYARNSFEALNTMLRAIYYPLNLSYHIFNYPGKLIIPDNKNPFLACWNITIQKEISDNEKKIFGITVTYEGQLYAALTLASKIKKKFQNAVIVFGGAVITRFINFMSNSLINRIFKYVDYVILYEGETAFLELVKFISNISNFNPINLAWKNVNGKIEKTKKVFFEDLNNLPIPDWCDYNVEDYLIPEIVLPYEAARGCYWGKCSFCSYGLNTNKEACTKYREKRSDKIVDDLITLHNKYGAKKFIFADDAMHPKSILRFAKKLAKIKIDFYLAIETRAEPYFVSEAFCQSLFKAGIKQVFFGIESANQRVLELMNKGVRADQFSKIYSSLNKTGIFVGIQTFTGFPGETFTESLETLNHIEKNSSQLGLAVNWDFCLLIGSRIYRSPSDYGISKINYSNKKEYYSEVDFETINNTLSSDQRKYLLSKRKTINLGDIDPWAGSAMSVHTLLIVAYSDNNCFKTWKNDSECNIDIRFHTVMSPYNIDSIETLINSAPTDCFFKLKQPKKIELNDFLFLKFPSHW